MASTQQKMGAILELQIKDSGTDGTYYTRNHTVGKWGHTMVRPTAYKMRGFNASTGQNEFWLAITPTQGPPSGASLSNIVIAAVILDVFPPVA